MPSYNINRDIPIRAHIVKTLIPTTSLTGNFCSHQESSDAFHETPVCIKNCTVFGLFGNFSLLGSPQNRSPEFLKPF